MPRLWQSLMHVCSIRLADISLLLLFLIKLSKCSGTFVSVVFIMEFFPGHFIFLFPALMLFFLKVSQTRNNLWQGLEFEEATFHINCRMDYNLNFDFNEQKLMKIDLLKIFINNRLCLRISIQKNIVLA